MIAFSFQLLLLPQLFAGGRFSFQFSINRQVTRLGNASSSCSYLTYTKVYRQLCKKQPRSSRDTLFPCAFAISRVGRRRERLRWVNRGPQPGHKTTSTLGVVDTQLQSVLSSAEKSCCVLSPEVSRTEARLWSWHCRCPYKFSATKESLKRISRKQVSPPLGPAKSDRKFLFPFLSVALTVFDTLMVFMKFY